MKQNSTATAQTAQQTIQRLMRHGAGSSTVLDAAMARLNDQSRANIQAIREKWGAASAVNAITEGFGLSA